MTYAPSQVARIESATAAIAKSIEGPIQALAKGTQELETTQLVCEVLRRTLRFVSLHRRLQKHLAQGVAHLPQAARCLAELAVMEQPDAMLRGVDVVEALLPELDATRAELRTRATNLLMEGLQSQSQQDVCNALLVFCAMGALRDKVRTAMSITTNRARRSVDAGIGAFVCETTAGATVDDHSGKDEPCWTALDATLGELQSHCVAVCHLQGLLLRTKDPLTGLTLWATLCREEEDPAAALLATLVEPFWVQLAAKLSSAVTATQRRALHKDYPRLRRLLHDFVRRVVCSYEMTQLPMAGGHRMTEAGALAHLVRPLGSLEVAHLDRAKRRLKKAADLLWPKVDDARTTALCHAMAREMSDARGAGAACAASVAALVVETTKAVAHECVSRADRNVATVVTQTQAHVNNAALISALLLMESCMHSLLFTATAVAADDAVGDESPIDGGGVGAMAKLEALLQDACASCQTATRTIFSHSVAQLRGAAAAQNTTELEAFRQTVLPLYKPSRVVQECLEGLPAWSKRVQNQ